MGRHDVESSEHTQAGDWIAPRLHRFGRDVGSIVPTGFDAYARLPESLRDGVVPILEKHTTTPHRCWLSLWDGYGYLHPGAMAPLVAFRIGPPPGRLRRWWLGAVLARQLARRPPLLAPMTPPPPRPPPFPGPPPPTEPRVHLPGRDYILYMGSASQGAGWEDGPNLWWPDDRAWCVASEIDLDETFVGGTRTLIDDILAREDLGARATTIDASHVAVGS